MAGNHSSSLTSRGANAEACCTLPLRAPHWDSPPAACGANLVGPASSPPCLTSSLLTCVSWNPLSNKRFAPEPSSPGLLWGGTHRRYPLKLWHQNHPGSNSIDPQALLTQLAPGVEGGAQGVNFYTAAPLSLQETLMPSQVGKS